MRILSVMAILICLHHCAAQQTESDTLSNYETIVPLSEGMSDSEVLDNSSLLKPQQPSTKTGALHVIVHPKTARIFINSQEVATGTTIVRDLAPGKYSLYITDGNNSEEQVVSVVSNDVRKVEVKLGRYVYFNVTSSFSNIWAHGVSSKGPSLDIGLKMGKQYFGLNYHWDFLDNYASDDWWEPDSTSPSRQTKGETFGGAAFQWYYDVYEIPNILYLSPGFCSGFWYNWTRKSRLNFDSISDYWYYDDYFSQDDYLFGGPSVRVSVGYKSAFVNCSYTLLLGTTVAHALVVGARFMF